MHILSSTMSATEQMQAARTSAETQPGFNSALKTVQRNAQGEITTLSQQSDDAIQQVLARVPPSLSSNALTHALESSDSLLNVAGTLSGEDLALLAQTVEGMEAQPQGLDKASFDALAQVLTKFDGYARSQVLEQAAELAHNVAPAASASGPYVGNAGSGAASDLHAFVKALAVSEDAALLLEQLESFEPEQQQTVLYMVSEDLGADALISELAGKDEKTRDSVMATLGSLVEEFVFGLEDTQEPQSIKIKLQHHDEIELVQRNYDDHAKVTVGGMIESLTDMMARYDFNDMQLRTMVDEFNHLSRDDQRAFLEITEIGLETLLGKDHAKVIDLSEHEAEADVIAELRANDSARALVYTSRLGNERTYEGREVFERKDHSAITQGVTNAVHVLTVNAWLTHKSDENGTTSSSQLSHHLRMLDATDRDRLVEEMARAPGMTEPLALLDDSTLGERFEKFQQMTSTVLNNHHGERLLVAREEAALNHDTFWQVAALAEQRLDLMTETLANTPEVGQQMVRQLTLLVDAAEAQPSQADQLKEEIAKVIDYWGAVSEAVPPEVTSRPERNPLAVDIEVLAQAEHTELVYEADFMAGYGRQP